MGPAGVLSLACAVAALHFGAANAWLWRERRSEPAHLWLAVTAAGVAIIATCDALLFEAAELERAQALQRVQFASAGLVVVGFLRFSSRFLAVPQPVADALGLAVAAASVLLAAAPEAVFDGSLRRDPIAGFPGERLAVAGLGAGGKLLFAAYGALFLHVLRLYARHLARVQDHRVAMLVTLCTWSTCATHDMAVTLGAYPGPHLLGVGYCAFLAAFSAILVRRFVRSTEEAERQADSLQRLVEERTEELRQKDLQLAHGERLATVATLAASCAHEINNPAAYVTSNLNRLAELWKAGRRSASAEFEEILGECREGVERIRATVAELLSLARSSDGERERVDFADAVRHALAVARHEARYRVEIEDAIAPVPAVLGDARLLGQVALNLILNAIQAAGAGRSPRPLVRVETSAEDDVVRLRVRDNGPGIPEALRPHLFDPLAAQRALPGGGFGLAVSHQIATSHGGRLALESGPGGTTATIELPAAPRGAPA